MYLADMIRSMTLNEILKQHPTWANLPLTISDSGSGYIEFVGASASIHTMFVCSHTDANQQESCDVSCPTRYEILVVEGN